MDSLKFRWYNALDAACTYQIRDTIWPDFDATDNWFAYDNTINLYEPLMYMQTRGLRVDFDALDKTRTFVVEDRNLKQQELNSLCGHELNVNSPLACQKYFYAEKGIKPYVNYKTKSITTDDLAMQRIARGVSGRPGLREAVLVQEIRGLQKLLGTYLDITFDSDGRIRCSYNPRGTCTGRLSSSKTIYETGTNLQNLPAEFKQFIVADEGYYFLELDKRQAEWVVVAYLSEDANMMGVIENNLDPHTHTAHLMFELDPEIIKLDAKLIGHSTDPEYINAKRTELLELQTARFLPRTMSLRQCGKKSNHGLNYDEGFANFSLINEIELPEAKRIVELYHKIYPNIRQLWYKRIQNALGRDRTIQNCFGRKYRFLDVWGDSLFKSAYAFQPQSTVVDGINLGMIQIYNDNSPHMQDLELLTQVHDSILLQIPKTQLSNIHKIIQTLDSHVSPDMTYHGRTFKIKTDFKLGHNWGEYSPDRNPLGMRDFSLADDAAVSYEKALGVLNATDVK
jgi:DNA polymerase I